MRIISISNLLPVLPALLFASQLAMAEDAKAVQQKLEAKYKLTVINAEGGVVTAGATLLLKMGLTAGPMSTCVSDYKDGKLALASVSKAICNTAGGKASKWTGLPGIKQIPGVGNAGSADTGARAFVMGEKLYVTKIEVKDSVNFSLVSDAIQPNNVVYKAEVRFQFPKGTPPDWAKADELAGEVFTISQDNPQAGGGAAGGQAQGGQAPAGQTPAPAAAPPPAPEPQPAALAPIEPPPPPPDAAPPPTLSLGLTIDQVVAILGQPKLIADSGKNKKIYTYPSLKITFADGKVSDIQ
jgi:hypothetical protein